MVVFVAGMGGANLAAGVISWIVHGFSPWYGMQIMLSCAALGAILGKIAQR